MYLARLMGYDYQILYRSGAHNQAADALSRIPDHHSSLSMILSVPCFTFLDELSHQLQQHEEYLSHRQHISNDPANFEGFVLTDKFILFRNRIWLPRNLPIIPTLLREFHATPTCGRAGVTKTLTRLSENFF